MLRAMTNSQTNSQQDSETNKHLTDTTFASLGLEPDLLKGIENAGFTKCTPIQAETIPIAIQGKDVAGQAQTGTGKSAAFLVPMFQQLLKNKEAGAKNPNPKAIILAPTRELAQQIYNDAQKLGEFTGLRLAVVYGGTGYDSQRQTLQDGVDVLIGTVGRLIDYFKQNIFNLKAIEVMILDEADRMFDLGFIDDIRYLFRRMPSPENRLSLMFSATLSHRVSELAYDHMHEPTRVEIETEAVTSAQINQTLYYPANDEKIPLLLGLFKSHHIERAVVFCNTKRATEKVSAFFAGNGHEVALLSGDVPQKKRLSLLKRFTDGELDIMVATDVAARGLHIPAVSHVFNYDLPSDAEDYVHRIGRTARAGASGEAISFACEDSVFSLPAIEEYIDSKIPVVSITNDMLIKPNAPIFPPRAKSPSRPRNNNGNRNNRNRNAR